MNEFVPGDLVRLLDDGDAILFKTTEYRLAEYAGVVNCRDVCIVISTKRDACFVLTSKQQMGWKRADSFTKVTHDHSQTRKQAT